MQTNEDIPVAYAVTQENPVCEIAYAYDVENIGELTGTQSVWVPVNGRVSFSNRDDFFMKIFVKLVKVVCVISLVVFCLNYLFVEIYLS